MHLFKLNQNDITSFSKQNCDSWPSWSGQFIFSQTSLISEFRKVRLWLWNYYSYQSPKV
jgi:hypothetical protein